MRRAARRPSDLVPTSSSGALALIGAELRSHVTILGTGLGLAWSVALVNTLMANALLSFGIHPRTVLGLLGIVFAPFLHAGFAHLIGNSIAFVLFGWMTLLRDRRHFALVTVLGFLSGFGTWLIGSTHSVHVGASGLIFAYFGFLLLGGWFSRSLGTIVTSLFVALSWGGLLFGVLPGQIGISWQGHLFGFLSGVLAASLVARSERKALPP